MNRLVVLAVAAVLVLSACGSESAEPRASAPTPTVEPTATPAQFASIIAEHQGFWRDYADSITDCAFARIIGDGDLDGIKVMICGMNASTVTMKAGSALKAIADLSVPDPEVAALVDRTVNALTPLSQIDAFDACEESTSDECGEIEVLVNGTIRPVIPVLDAWSPYLN